MMLNHTKFQYIDCVDKNSNFLWFDQNAQNHTCPYSNLTCRLTNVDDDSTAFSLV